MTLEERIEQEKLQIEENREKLAYAVTLDNQHAFDTCMQNIERHEQLAEWLEELKAFRENKWTDIYIKRGYDKAIDDYMNKLCDHCMQQTNECYKLECPFCTDGCDIVNIAEQLKTGRKEREAE